MDEDRCLQYQDKNRWIHGRADLIETWFKESGDISNDTKTMLAIFKAFQEITEATMDCISMDPAGQLRSGTG